MHHLTVQYKNEVVKSGEQLEGEVYLNITKPINFTTITLHIFGEEGAQELHRKDIQVVTLKNQKQTAKPIKKFGFFHDQIILTIDQTTKFVSSQSTTSKTNGYFILPFSVLLPDILSPSFNLNEPIKVYTRYFSVPKITSQQISLNQILNYTEQEEFSFMVIDGIKKLEMPQKIDQKDWVDTKVTRTCEKTFPLKAGVIIATGELPKINYQKGERISIKINVRNSTPRVIKQMNVTLNQYVYLRNISTESKIQKIYKSKTINRIEIMSPKFLTQNSTLKIEDFFVPAPDHDYHIVSSFKSKNFSVVYDLTIELIPTSIVVNNFSVTFPITIESPFIYISPTEISLNSPSDDQSKFLSPLPAPYLLHNDQPIISSQPQIQVQIQPQPQLHPQFLPQPQTQFQSQFQPQFQPQPQMQTAQPNQQFYSAYPPQYSSNQMIYSYPQSQMINNNIDNSNYVNVPTFIPPNNYANNNNNVGGMPMANPPYTQH